MGAQASSSPGLMNSTTLQGPQGAVQSGAHSPLPVDTVPYPGPKLEYHMINITAHMNVQAGFFSGSMMTTNVDAYYPTMVQPYQHGFKMIQFQTIPGVKSQAGWFSQAVPFQAILTRPIGVPPSHERWNLQIVKSFIELQRFYSFSSWSTNGQTANTNDVMTKIMEMTQKGARLICIEPTGAQQGPSFSSGFQGHAGTIGVDLLFHTPQHPNPTPYVYHGIHVSIAYNVQAGFGMPRYQCLTDLNAQFAAFLNQGWKLVEINLDSSQAQFGGVAASRHNWDPILIEMGQRGWELACILETPETHQSGLTTATTTILLFFQRPIYYPSS